MTHESMIALLQHEHMGRLACVKESQPYVTPMSFSFHENYLYSFATEGKKVSWMRVNPLVCVEVESIVSLYRWKTVIASGRYEELPNSSEHVEQRVLAFNLLSKTSNWWEPGFVRTCHRGVVRPLEAVYFRIRITELTGHEATQEANPV
jgi:hypothetical protein